MRNITIRDKPYRLNLNENSNIVLPSTIVCTNNAR